MEETTNKSGMSTGMIIGIAVIVAFVFGGGAYAYVNNKAEKEKKDLNAQITELQSQVTSAKTATATTPSSSTSTTTTTDATANWKTYTNPDYGLSFKYPNDWTLGSGESSVYLQSPETIKRKEEGQFPGADMWVGYYSSVNKLDSSATGTLLDYLNKLASSTNGSILKESTIGDKASYDINEVGEGGFLSIYVPVGEKVIHITFDGVLNRGELSSEGSRIVSTFQFTK